MRRGSVGRVSLYTPINPKTGKPFWNCRRCRLRSAARYKRTGKQGHGQGALVFDEAAA